MVSQENFSLSNIGLDLKIVQLSDGTAMIAMKNQNWKMP
jgi:hypothetical protein